VSLSVSDPSSWGRELPSKPLRKRGCPFRSGPRDEVDQELPESIAELTVVAVNDLTCRLGHEERVGRVYPGSNRAQDGLGSDGGREPLAAAWSRRQVDAGLVGTRDRGSAALAAPRQRKWDRKVGMS
jgi:hypothetical protein